MAQGRARSYQRRRWLVAPAYQLRVVGMLVGFLCAVVVVTLGLVYLALWSTLQTLELWHETVFVAVFKSVAWTITLELLVAIPAIMVMGVLMTHRVVGPLGRITAALDRISQGQYDVRLVLRKGDVLSELANAINRTAAALQRRHTSH